MSWHPEHHLPGDPGARPTEGDIAGWCRFYAWSYGDRPWGSGEGAYDGSCQAVAFVRAADEIDRLRALLKAERHFSAWRGRLIQQWERVIRPRLVATEGGDGE